MLKYAQLMQWRQYMALAAGIIKDNQDNLPNYVWTEMAPVVRKAPVLPPPPKNTSSASASQSQSSGSNVRKQGIKDVYATGWPKYLHIENSCFILKRDILDVQKCKNKYRSPCLFLR